MDAARAANLSCYGHDYDTSPRIDTLAEDGLRFERAIPPAPATFDSVTSILSGTYPAEHQSGRVMEVNTSEPLLPEVLSEMGYTTGFATSSPGTTPEFGYGSGVDRFYDVTNKYDGMNAKKFFDETRDLPRWRRYLRFGREAADRNFVSNVRNAVRFRFGVGDDDGATDVTAAAKEFVTEAEEPWFLYLHFTETHLNINGDSPYILPDEARTRFAGEDVDTDDLASTGGDVDYSPEQMERHERIYDGAIRYLDGKVGEIVDALEASGQFDRTTFVATSDHGEALGENGHMGHGVLDEPVMDVPLVIHGPDVPNGVVADRVNLLWLYRTLAEIGGEAPEHAPGGNLLHDEFPEYVLCQNFTGSWDWSSYASDEVTGEYALYEGDFKLLSDGEETELYDVSEDPGETTDLSSRRSERADKLERELQRFLDDLDRVAAPQEAEIDEQTERRLHDLGYLG